jgi:hypothetical protein
MKFKSKIRRYVVIHIPEGDAEKLADILMDHISWYEAEQSYTGAEDLLATLHAALHEALSEAEED